jgi:hypothetical protein
MSTGYKSHCHYSPDVKYLHFRLCSCGPISPALLSSGRVDRARPLLRPVHDHGQKPVPCAPNWDLAHISDDDVCRSLGSPHLPHRRHWPLPSAGGTGGCVPLPPSCGGWGPQPRYPAGRPPRPPRYVRQSPELATIMNGNGQAALIRSGRPLTLVLLRSRRTSVTPGTFLPQADAAWMRVHAAGVAQRC